MKNRTNIGVLVGLMTCMLAMTAVIGLPAGANGHGGGHGGGGYGGGGYGGGGHGGYHHGHGYGYPAYYAPAYNDYGYRGYAPYPVYSGDVALGAAAGALIGGLVAPSHGHVYEY